jgi:natural product precursor
MKKLSNFSKVSISKSEMKQVKGGREGCILGTDQTDFFFFLQCLQQ